MSPNFTVNTRPAVSEVLADGTLVETLYDRAAGKTSLAVCMPDGKIFRVPHFDVGGGVRLAPYSARNNLLTSGSVLLSSDVGDFGDKGDLLQAIRRYFRSYVDLSPAIEDIAAHYVLLTWVYDSFQELGYLRFRGHYGTGKTRALLTVGSICYKPFFASGASTVSPIFHVLDRFGGTLVLDEADFRFSDATAELTKILNNGTVNGLPVLRTMSTRNGELQPQAFRVFGPKLIGMRHSFQDRALESRFLTEETGRRPLPPHIPIHLPKALAEDALQLRNRLLAWRFHARHKVEPDATRLIAGIEPRLNQTALALLSLVDDDTVRDRIRDELVGQEARVLNERASTLEATMLQSLVEAFAASSAPHIAVADAAQRFNKSAAGDLGKVMTPKWIGGFIRTRLRLNTIKSGGVYVVPQTEWPKVQVLAKRYGLTAAQAADGTDAA